MDGVFMRKLIKIVWTLVLVLLLFCVGGLMADRQQLYNSIIRLHVVANSDAESDQQLKLKVKDAVVFYLDEHNIRMQGNKEYAYKFLSENLDEIASVANDTLRKLGSSEKASATLGRREFGTRQYETFSLPAGVYDSLQITIGEGTGKNWWCVVFPALCAPATTDEFKSVAVSSGFENGLSNTLGGESGYRIRFFFLDCLGKIENFFYFG